MQAYSTQTNSPFVALGANFIKEVLRQGAYQHPIRPWPQPLEATPEYLEALARRSNNALAAGVEVPLPDGHNDGAKDNAGWVRRFFVGDNDEGGLSLFVEAEVTDSDYEAKIREGTISKVSVWIDDFGDGQFDPGGDRVVHVALTSYPVASKQGGFVALSSKDVFKDVPVLLRLPPKETAMILSLTAQKAKSLGLSVADGTDAVELSAEALAALIASQEAAQAEVATLRSDLAARAASVTLASPADIALALSVDPSKDRYFVRSHTGFKAAVDAEVTQAITAGRITIGQAEDFRALLSVEQSYTLSADGKASPFDVAATARKVLASIPDNAAVPVEALATSTLPVKVEGKGLSASEVATAAGELLAVANKGTKD